MQKVCCGRWLQSIGFKLHYCPSNVKPKNQSMPDLGVVFVGPKEAGAE